MAKCSTAALLTVMFATGIGLLAGSQSRAAGEIVKAYGSKSAPITMEVFSDYQCPACRELF